LKSDVQQNQYLIILNVGQLAALGIQVVEDPIEELPPRTNAAHVLIRGLSDNETRHHVALLVSPGDLIGVDGRTLSMEPDEAFPAADLPDLPTQGPGPHFELTRKGVIDFVPPEALDRNGNNVARLRQLHPILRDLARELAEALGAGNIPHANLAARIGEYRKQVDQSLDKIDFALLYVEGLRLANAEKAAIEKIAEGELPPFGETDREALDTLLGLHGTFMLGTIAGAELIDAEQRYRRRPAEESEYRVAAVDFAASLQNKPDVIAPNAAAFVLGAAEQIGQGANLERSGVIATSAILNVAITFTAVAVVTALPVFGGVIGGPGRCNRRRIDRVHGEREP
jgi:hypothetical protein